VIVVIPIWGGPLRRVVYLAALQGIPHEVTGRRHRRAQAPGGTYAGSRSPDQPGLAVLRGLAHINALSCFDEVLPEYTGRSAQRDHRPRLILSTRPSAVQLRVSVRHRRLPVSFTIVITSSSNSGAAGAFKYYRS